MVLPKLLRQQLQRPRYELIPTKNVDEQLTYLPVGSTISVTCSSSQGIDATIELAEKIMQLGQTHKAVPHLAARMIESPSHLEDILTRIKAANIQDVFLVGGDVESLAGRPYPNSFMLAKAVRRLDAEIKLGVAGYPEGHPLIADAELEADLLVKQPYVDYVVTQMCFDAEAIIDWVSKMQRHGLGVAVIVGVPGVVHVTELIKIAKRIGVGDSLKFLTKQPKTILKSAAPGTKQLTNLITKLGPLLADTSNLITGFHFYSFNQIQLTEKWRQDCLAVV